MTGAPFQLFPMLDPAVDAALRESIQRFGVLVPVAKDQHGRVLDGHQRSRIADELGVDYRVDIHVVADDAEAREIARTLNADRRHLSIEQRRKVAATLREQGHSLRAIAGAVGVSEAQVHRDLATVTDVTVPDRITGRDGKRGPAKRSVVAARDSREADRAQQAISAIENPPQRVMDVKRAERIAREQNAERQRGIPVEPPTRSEDIEIRHGSLTRALNDLDGQVDAIITDPPYPKEHINLFDDLANVAVRILKPDGILVAMVGQSHLPEYIQRLSQKLAYRWTACYLAPGRHTRVHGRKISTGWKPLLIYGGGDSITIDVFESGANDKEHHHWGQSESGMADIITGITSPGQLVVDPFLGGGTTAIVCRDLNRRFIGCDIDANAIRSTMRRLQS